MKMTVCELLVPLGPNSAACSMAMVWPCPASQYGQPWERTFLEIIVQQNAKKRKRKVPTNSPLAATKCPRRADGFVWLPPPVMFRSFSISQRENVEWYKRLTEEWKNCCDLVKRMGDSTRKRHHRRVLAYDTYTQAQATRDDDLRLHACMKSERTG